MIAKQPFRAGDVVRVKLGPCKDERWVVAVYEAPSNTAFIAGWPCTMVTKATQAVELVEACTDKQHADMIESVAKMRGDHGEGDPRRSALERVQAIGGVP